MSVRSFWKEHKLLIAAVVLWIILSQWMIFSINRDFWFDESFSAQTVEILRQTGPTAIEFSEYDVHPPAYYAVLYVWSFLKPWGVSEHYWHRELSAVLGAIFIIFAYIGLRKVFGKDGEIAAMTLPLFSSILHYGTEARMYVLLLAVSAMVFAAIAYELKGYWFTAALIGILLFPFIHYVAAGASIYFILVYVIYAGKEFNKAKVWIMAIVAVLAIAATLMVYWLPQMARIDRMWLPTASATGAESAVFHNFFYVDERVNGPPLLIVFFIILYVAYEALLLFFGYMGVKWAIKGEYRTDPKKRMMLAMGIAAIGEAAGLVVLSNVGRITLFHARYFLVVGWLFVALASVVLARLMMSKRAVLAHMCMAAFVVLSGIMLFAYVEGAHLDISQLMKTVPCNGSLNKVVHDTPFTALPFETWNRENGCEWDNYVTTSGTVREARSAGFDAIPKNKVLWNQTFPDGEFYYVTSEDVDSLYEGCNKTLVEKYSWEFDPASIWIVKCRDALVMNVSVGNFSNMTLPDEIYVPGMR